MTTGHTVAVTGASGFLGGALVRRLIADHRVRALVRRPDTTGREIPAAVDVVAGDLDDRRALTRLVHGVDVVYHCAATMKKSDPALSRRVNEIGTENVARAAGAIGVRRFVYVSSISVFAATRTPDGVVTEQVAPHRVERLNAYARTKYAGEQRLRAIARAHGLPFTIIRPTNVYGPGSGPWFHQFERMLRRLPIALGDLPIDLVHVDDVVDAMLLAAEAPAAADGVFHIGHQMVKMNRFILEIARVTRQRARPLPVLVDRAVRFAVDRLYRLATGTHMSMSLVRPVRYPHALATSRFGYAPRVGLEEGMARLAMWYDGDTSEAGSRPHARLVARE